MSASFDTYKIFYYVAKSRNITHAANALFLSQSTVSRAIQSLESELGCKLFERSHQGATLTRKGQLLYDYVSSACERIFSAEDQLRELQFLGSDCIRVGFCDETPMLAFLPPALAEFRKRNPQVPVDLVTRTLLGQQGLCALLLRDELDFLCAVEPNTELHSTELLLTPLAALPCVLLASNRFAELNGPTISLSALQSYPFLSVRRGDAAPSILHRAFAAQGTAPQPVYTAETMSQCLALASQGLGLIIIPKILCPEAREHGLFAVSLAQPLPDCKLCLITRRADAPSAAGEALIRCIQKQLDRQNV